MTAHIAAQRTEHKVPVATSCRALGVSESWFYRHHNAEPTPAAQRRAELDVAVAEVFAAHDGEYGSPRIHAELIERSEWARLDVKSVAVSMSRQGLVAKAKRVRRSLTRPDKTAYKFPNLLNRQFNPAAANVAWVGDITEIKTWEGKLYLATVIDLYSRRLIGFAIAEHCRAPLVCDALKMAIAARGGKANIGGVIMHTDRGSQGSTPLTRSPACAAARASPSRCQEPGHVWTTPWPNRFSPPSRPRSSTGPCSPPGPALATESQLGSTATTGSVATATVA